MGREMTDWRRLPDLRARVVDGLIYAVWVGAPLAYFLDESLAGVAIGLVAGLVRFLFASLTTRPE